MAERPPVLDLPLSSRARWRDHSLSALSRYHFGISSFSRRAISLLDGSSLRYHSSDWNDPGLFSISPVQRGSPSNAEKRSLLHPIRSSVSLASTVINEYWRERGSLFRGPGCYIPLYAVARDIRIILTLPPRQTAQRSPTAKRTDISSK